MKRRLPIAVAFVALAVLGISIIDKRTAPRPGEIADTFETTNQTFKLRVDLRPEVQGFAPVLDGAYYVFQSAPVGSNSWKEIMTFQHDDPIPIPRDQVRFVNANVGYVFMGWMYAVTTDAGTTWSVWNAQKNLPKWQCCNYRLIKDAQLAPDGTGVMQLSVIPERQGEVPELRTEDYGRHWHIR